MATISFGGLATGMDSGAIIDKLVALEKSQATALATRRNQTERRITILSDLATKLRSLRTATEGVDKPEELKARTASVAGTELTATTSSAAQPGSWTVKVDRLARAETTRSQVLPTRAAGAVADGSVQITAAGKDPVSVSYAATDSLDVIAARINADVPGVDASVVDVGGGFRLMISSEQTGVASGIEFSGGAELGLEEIEDARDAQVTIAGTTISRPTNTISDVITGVTLNLSATTAAGSNGATITVKEDAAGQRAKVQGVVDAYNAIAKVLTSQLSYNGTKKGEDTLFGDSTMQGLQRSLGRIVTSAVTDGAGQITGRDLGITMSADGTLALDATKFDAAIAASPDKAGRLLSGESGLGAQLAAVVDQMVATSTGVLSAKQTGLRSRTKGFDEQIDRINTAADALGDRLRRQFTALEVNVSAMNSNLTYLSALFAR